MEIKRKSNVSNYVKVIIGVIVFIISIQFVVGSVFDRSYYKACAEDIRNGNVEVETEVYEGKEVPGRAPMDNPIPFNNINTVGNYSYRQLEECSLAFYKNTGIQLYFMLYDFGKEKFESEREIKEAVQAKIQEIDNLENSMVIYGYNTDFDYDSKYCYYVEDKIYYGTKVSEYLTSDDLKMINFYLTNAYEIWDFSNIYPHIWNTIGECIASGYNTADLVITNDNDWDITFYDEQVAVCTFVAIVSSIVSIISIVLIIFGIRGIIKVNKLNIKAMETEIEYVEAHTTKTILEADLNPLESEEDLNLVSKYSDNK